VIEHTALIASHWIGLNHNQLLVLLALQVRRRVFVRILPACIDHLLDVVGRSDDSIDHVTVDDVHEAMLHSVKRDDPLTPIRVVAQTPCDMVAYLNLRSGLAEINVPTVVQFKAHDAPRKAVHIKTTIRPLEAIRAVIEGGVESPTKETVYASVSPHRTVSDRHDPELRALASCRRSGLFLCSPVRPVQGYSLSFTRSLAVICLALRMRNFCRASRS
jgi:hypothetical protein